MRLLDERRALVTGGAVATVDVEPVDDFGANVLAIQRDLAKTDGLEALVDEVEKTLGPLDVLHDVYVRYGKLPMRRYAQPSEIAARVAWLASSENSYVTGQALTVDGRVTVTF